SALPTHHPSPDASVDLTVRRPAMLYNSSLLHHVTGTGDSSRTADVLLHEQQRDALAAHSGKRFENFTHDHRGQAFGRFIHKQELWRSDQGADDRQHMLIAAGEGLAELATSLAQARKETEHAVEPAALFGG